MNKKALVEFVRTAILKSEAVADNQKTVHFKRVEQGVGYAFDTLLGQMPMNEDGKLQVEQYFVKHYYNQPVYKSSGYRYVGVSDAVVPVGEGRGVWYVQPSGGGKPFSQARRPSVAFFRNLPVGKVINETYWRLGNISDNIQIIFEEIGNSPFTDVRTVDYGIVRAFSAYDDDEEIRVPGGRIDGIMELTLAWMAGVYQDKTNNNQ
jgi:hypothetical protein